MKRMKVLFGQRRIMVLATLAILVLTAAALVASSASFTATSANPGNVFTSGSFDMFNSRDGNPVVSFTTPNFMRPGDSAVGTVGIGNTGNVTGTFAFASTAIAGSDAALAGKLTLDIVEVNASGTPVVGGYTYSGTVATVPASQTFAGWAGGVTRYFRFSVTWPNAPRDDAWDNAHQGLSCGFDLAWTAVSDNTTN